MSNLQKDFPKRGSTVKGYRHKSPITIDAKYGWISSGQFPADCIADCSASGPVDAAVEYWCEKIKFDESLRPHRALVERYLREFGAWEDLKTANDVTLAHRVLWIACCDISEQGEWSGLVH